MHYHFKFRKVHRELKDRGKINRLGLSLKHPLRYADEGEDTSMLKKFLTGKESWVHHYKSESKPASMQWKHPSSPSAKKLEV
jgi:hypothetical protein